MAENTRKSFDEIVSEYLEEHPDSPVAQLSMNSFQMSLARLLQDHPEKMPEKIMGLVDTLGALLFSTAHGDLAEVAFDVKLVSESILEKARNMHILIRTGKVKARDVGIRE